MFARSHTLHKSLLRGFVTPLRTRYTPQGVKPLTRAYTQNTTHAVPTSTQDSSTLHGDHAEGPSSNDPIASVPSSSPTDPQSGIEKFEEYEGGAAAQTTLPAQEKSTTNNQLDPRLPSLPSELLPLPSVPEVPPKLLTRWLRVQDCETYLTPLYQRGWFVSTQRLPDGRQRKYLSLKREFKLRKRVWAAAFMKQVADVMIARKHDGTMILDTLLVTVELHTHTAFVRIDDIGRIEHPGITILDAGLAIEIEKLWEQCVDDDQVLPVNIRPTIVPIRVPKHGHKMHTRTLSFTALKLNYIGDLVICLACRGAHRIQDCPTRHTIRPPRACSNCHEWHWMVDCPLSGVQKLSNKQLSRTAPTSSSPSASSPSPPPPSPTLISHADAEPRETDFDSARRMESPSA